MRVTLSKYKLRKIAEESLRNGIRLHLDSIILYTSDRFPSALQLSIISMEEIAKAKWVENYYFHATTNDWPTDAKFEQKWLDLLYLHTKKQYAFLGRDFDRYSPAFVKLVQDKRLEDKKQKATYVGLNKVKGKADVNSRISIPEKITKNDAKKMISIINDELKEMCKLKIEHEYHFWIPEMDDIIDESLLELLKLWNHRSGIRSDKWFKEWKKRF